MRHTNISVTFLLKNVKTPENILKAFSESAYGTNDSNSQVFIQCELIAESNDTEDIKKEKLTKVITDYHTSLYK